MADETKIAWYYKTWSDNRDSKALDMGRTQQGVGGGGNPATTTTSVKCEGKDDV